MSPFRRLLLHPLVSLLFAAYSNQENCVPVKELSLLNRRFIDSLAGVNTEYRQISSYAHCSALPEAFEGHLDSLTAMEKKSLIRHLERDGRLREDQLDMLPMPLKYMARNALSARVELHQREIGSACDIQEAHKHPEAILHCLNSTEAPLSSREKLWRSLDAGAKVSFTESLFPGDKIHAECLLREDHKSLACFYEALRVASAHSCSKLLHLEPEDFEKWPLNVVKENSDLLHCLPSKSLFEIASLRFVLSYNPSALAHHATAQLPLNHRRVLVAMALPHIDTTRPPPRYMDGAIPARSILGGEIELEYSNNLSPLAQLATVLMNQMQKDLNLMLSSQKIQQMLPFVASEEFLRSHFWEIVRVLETSEKAPGFSQKQLAHLLDLLIETKPDDWMLVLETSHRLSARLLPSLNCRHLEKVRSSYAVGLIYMYRESVTQPMKETILLPSELVKCFQNLVQSYLADKARLLCLGPKSEPLHGLNLAEVRRLGGMAFLDPALPLGKAVIRTDIELQILEEIAVLPLTELMQLADYTRLKMLSQAFWKQLSMLSGDNRGNLQRMASLLFFATDMDTSSLTVDDFVDVNAPFCLNDVDMMSWEGRLPIRTKISVRDIFTVLPFIDDLFMDQPRSDMENFFEEGAFALQNAFLFKNYLTAHGTRINFRSLCMKWLSTHNQSHSKFEEKVYLASRHLAGLDSSHMRTRRQAEEVDQKLLSIKEMYDLVRQKWRQLRKKGHLSREVSRAAPKLFQKFHKKNIARQKEILGINQTLTDEQVLAELQRRTGNLSREEEKQLHESSDQLRLELIQEVGKLLGDQMPDIVITAMLNYTQRNKKEDEGDPVVPEMRSAANESNEEDYLLELLNLTRAQMDQQLAGQQEPQRASVERSPIQQIVSPLTYLPWSALSQDDLQECSVLQLWALLEHSDVMDMSHRQANFVLQRLEQTIDPARTELSDILSLVPVLSHVEQAEQLHLFLGDPVELVKTQPWGLEAVQMLAKLVHRQQDLVQWLQPLMNCTRHQTERESDVNFWIMTLACLEPILCHLNSNQLQILKTCEDHPVLDNLFQELKC